MTAALRIRPITPTIGAEVGGVDLAVDLDDPEIVALIKHAFLEHHVLVFRDQQLTTEQHKNFGRLFGDLHIHPSQRGKNYEGDREIFRVHADETTVLNNGGLWHSDVSCDEIPPLGSMLLLTAAPTHGGDTLFANMHEAYASLSDPMKALLRELTAVHDQRRDLSNYGYEPRPGVDYPRQSHPVVVAHPDTNQPLLFVNSAFTTHIEGLSAAESDALLALLNDHVANNPRLQCRVRWEPGTLTFWDNRCVQHFAVWDYRPQVRTGNRVTIAGASRPTAFVSAT